MRGKVSRGAACGADALVEGAVNPKDNWTKGIPGHEGFWDRVFRDEAQTSLPLAVFICPAELRLLMFAPGLSVNRLRMPSFYKYQPS